MKCKTNKRDTKSASELLMNIWKGLHRPFYNIFHTSLRNKFRKIPFFCFNVPRIERRRCCDLQFLFKFLLFFFVTGRKTNANKLSVCRNAGKNVPEWKCVRSSANTIESRWELTAILSFIIPKRTTEKWEEKTATKSGIKLSLNMFACHSN